jgi:hypothetical protein
MAERRCRMVSRGTCEVSSRSLLHSNKNLNVDKPSAPHCAVESRPDEVFKFWKSIMRKKVCHLFNVSPRSLSHMPRRDLCGSSQVSSAGSCSDLFWMSNAGLLQGQYQVCCFWLGIAHFVFPNASRTHSLRTHRRASWINLPSENRPACRASASSALGSLFPFGWKVSSSRSTTLPINPSMTARPRSGTDRSRWPFRRPLFRERSEGCFSF